MRVFPALLAAASLFAAVLSLFLSQSAWVWTYPELLALELVLAACLLLSFLSCILRLVGRRQRRWQLSLLLLPVGDPGSLSAGTCGAWPAPCPGRRQSRLSRFLHSSMLAWPVLFCLVLPIFRQGLDFYYQDLRLDSIALLERMNYETILTEDQNLVARHFDGTSQTLVWARSPAAGSSQSGPGKIQRVLTLARESLSSILARLDRYAIPEGLDKVIMPGAFLRALLLGERDALDPRLSLLFRDAGILHILSLSGFHLGLVATLAWPFKALYGWAMRRLAISGRMPPPWLYLGLERISSSVFLTAIACYVFLAIPGPGLYRAALMLFMSSLAALLKRRWTAMDSLWLSMAILLQIHPGFIEEWGFALSYLSLFGLLAAEPILKPLISRISFRWIGGYLASGTAALWAALPYLCLVAKVPMVLNGILTGPFFGFLVSIWALLGGVWLVLPLEPMARLIHGFADFSQLALLHARPIPVLPLRSPYLELVLLVWILLGVLILLPPIWYRALRHDRLRLAKIPEIPPGSARFLHEKVFRSKLHDRSPGKTQDPVPGSGREEGLGDWTGAGGLECGSPEHCQSSHRL